MRRTVAILFIFLLLLSNLGLTMGVHYCGGFAVETKFAIGHADLHCGMPDMRSNSDCASDASKEIHIKKKPCCENKYQSFDQDDEYAPQIVKDTINPEFAVAYFITLFDPHHSRQNDQTKYLNYSPPLIGHDIPIMIQSFLI